MLALILVGVMLVCGTAIASSARRTETIDVTYDVIDGLAIDPKDAQGNKVEPFIYNGTTYLPVRAVGEAFGKNVSWDGSTMTVYVGPKPGEVQDWFSQCKPYQYSGGDEFKLEDNNFFMMSGKKYSNGFALGSDNDFALFNLDSKYQSVTFTIGHVDDTDLENANLNIYIDGKIAYTQELRCDDVARTLTIPLNGALQMKIEITDGWGPQWGFANGHFE